MAPLAGAVRAAAALVLAAALPAAGQGVIRLEASLPAPAAVPPIPASAKPQLYSCEAEYGMWETAWTPDWKAWCCENENRGCPSTTTTTATTTTRTHTTSTSMTETETTTTATSTTRTKTSTTETSTATRTRTRTRTRTSTSTATATTTTATATSTTTQDPCETTCTFEYIDATCNGRIHWANEHFPAEGCKAAHDLVLTQCPVCGQCSLEASACNASSTFKTDSAAVQFRQQFEEPAAAGGGRGTASWRTALLGLPVVAVAAGLSLLAVAARRRVRSSRDMQPCGRDEVYMRAEVEDALL